MGRYATDNGVDFTPAPAGTHLARCIRLTDIGSQHGEYQGKPTVRNQVIITWELCGTKMTDGQPFIVSAWLTNSLNEKANMRKFLEAWRGRPFTMKELTSFDLETILGKACMLQVVHTEKKKAKVNAIIALPKNTTVPPQVNPSSTFWIDTATDEQFAALTDGIKAIIARSDEWKERMANRASATSKTGDAIGEPDEINPDNDITEEDVPF